ncbi:MAG: type II secretion system protein M [Candidatus Parcubacteria bacterium]|nr:type II secretion system protein M [Burkholderiales bacterium]
MKPRESMTAFWRSRSPRERFTLGSAASVVAVALLYLLIWEPGMVAREKLSATLPRMRAQLDDISLQQKEVLALRKQIESAPQRAELKVLLQDSAARAPFSQAVERVDAVAADRVFFAAGPVDFDAWLDWAAGIQRDIGARVDSTKIVATKQAGLVRVEATFVARKAPVTRGSP